MTHKILIGNCKESIKALEDNSIDSIVTDPPYELGFMGKSWDKSGIAYDVVLWKECLRVLKPGGHLIAFSGSRTYHRMAVAIEDAGFDIRDQIMWIYGSGFPKSMDIAKAIDKSEGVEFETKPAEGVGFMNAGDGDYNTTKNQMIRIGEMSDKAKQWEGWGTALKPAHEPMVLARKPIEGTVAQNVLAHGTGGLNIDASRIPAGEDHAKNCNRTSAKSHWGSGEGVAIEANAAGRFPANIIHDGSEEVLEHFPHTTSGKPGVIRQAVNTGTAYGKESREAGTLMTGFGDSGSAARFFYCAKPSKKEKGDFNNHPTVKPIELMRHLVKMVTPVGGVVLDPFLGSGTTGVAAVKDHFNFIGCELSPEFAAIAERRISEYVDELEDVISFK